jgi:hypothetical protein
MALVLQACLDLCDAVTGAVKRRRPDTPVTNDRAPFPHYHKADGTFVASKQFQSGSLTFYYFMYVLPSAEDATKYMFLHLTSLLETESENGRQGMRLVKDLQQVSSMTPDESTFYLRFLMELVRQASVRLSRSVNLDVDTDLQHSCTHEPGEHHTAATPMLCGIAQPRGTPVVHKLFVSAGTTAETEDDWRGWLAALSTTAVYVLQQQVEEQVQKHSILSGSQATLAGLRDDLSALQDVLDDEVLAQEEHAEEEELGALLHQVRAQQD